MPTIMLFVVLAVLLALAAVFFRLGAKLVGRRFDGLAARGLGGALAMIAGLFLVAVAIGLLPESALVPVIETIIYQGPDPDFVPGIGEPAYEDTHPRVLIDEAHFNFHTRDGSYRGFADLIEADGYVVATNTEPFTLETLRPYDVLVIANARGGGNEPGRRGEPAFTEAECDAVYEWVSRGGSLLLVADHAPYGRATRALADRFGVQMTGGGTFDPVNNAGSDSRIVFSRDNGLLAEHPITAGRNPQERLERVVSLGGQSLRHPADGSPLLVLSEHAYDVAEEDYGSWWSGHSRRAPAGGGAQAIALEPGAGRVVVLAEAAMITAQVSWAPFVPRGPVGMHTPGTDNQQFALNVMHWLSRLMP